MPRKIEIIKRNSKKVRGAIEQKKASTESLITDVPKRLEKMIQILYILSEKGKRKTSEFEIVKKAFESHLKVVKSNKQIKATHSFLQGKETIPGLNLFEIKGILNQKLYPDLRVW